MRYVTITIDGKEYRLEGTLTAVPIEDNGEEPPPPNGDIEPPQLTPDNWRVGHDTIPNFVRDPDTWSVSDGDWHDESTWSHGVPTQDSMVQIDHAVTIGGEAESHNVNVLGSLRLSSGASLKVVTLTVPETGALLIGTPDEPAEDVEIVFRDVPLDLENDPEQWSNGLLVFHEAEALLYAPAATGHLRVSQAPQAGDAAIHLASEPANWNPGDRLWLPDTSPPGGFSNPRGYQVGFPLREYVTIASVEGGTVALTEPLEFDHAGQGNHNTHVAHLSGSVVFRSENPEGTRGHILFGGRAYARIHNVVWAGLGRTTREPWGDVDNRVGKYAMHTHHLLGPEDLPDDVPQFEIVGCRIVHGSRWGIAIHGSHYGLIADNVVVDVEGVGLMLEDGTEYGNTFRNNFIASVEGSGSTSSRAAGNVAFPGEEVGFEGVGIWSWGTANHFVGNVTVNMQEGTSLYDYMGPVTVPAFKGADPAVDGVSYERYELDQQHFEWRDNEAYGVEIANRWRLPGRMSTSQPGSFTAHNLIAWATQRGAMVSYCHQFRIEGGDVRARSVAIDVAPFLRRGEISGMSLRGRIGVQWAPSHDDSGLIQGCAFQTGRSDIQGYEGDNIELIDNVYSHGDPPGV